MSIRQKRSVLSSMHINRVIAENDLVKTKIFIRTNPDKMVELEFSTMRLFCSYRVTVAMFDKNTKEYFRTDMDKKIVNHDIDKWLKGAEATQKPQQFFTDILSPESV